MNKSLKFLVISLLMVPTLARAMGADDSATQSWGDYAWAKAAYALSGVTAGATHFSTGFAGGLPGGALATVGHAVSKSRIENGLKRDAINAFVVVGSGNVTLRATQLAERRLNINTDKTTYQSLANLAGNGAGWFVGNVLVAGFISEAQKRSGGSKQN